MVARRTASAGAATAARWWWTVLKAGSRWQAAAAALPLPRRAALPSNLLANLTHSPQAWWPPEPPSDL